MSKRYQKMSYDPGHYGTAKKSKFEVNQVYTLKGKQVVFLGNQDGPKGHLLGFFRELANPDTFFGAHLSQVKN